jgi:glycosyltransferase involved in cell wall biosynthesis
LILTDTEWLFAHNVCSLNKNLPLTAALHRIAANPGLLRIALWHHDLAWATPRYAAEMHSGLPWDLLRTDWPQAVQITVSQHRRRELAQLLGSPEERIRVIPNGIDIPAFTKFEPETTEIVARFDLLESSPLILLPVRITPRKNIELALRVLSQLLRRHPRARLLITGPVGPHNATNAAYLESLLALKHALRLDECALFLALAQEQPISDEVVSDLHRLADIMLLPSREEGFGIPILEAGLAGVPVFCSKIEPLKELGTDHVTYFTPDEDPAHVADAISRSLGVSKRYALRKKVMREYAWPRIYAEHIAPLLEGR